MTVIGDRDCGIGDEDWGLGIGIRIGESDRVLGLGIGDWNLD